MEPLTTYQRSLVSRALFYQNRDKAIPVDLEAALAAEGMSLETIPVIKEDING